MNISSKSFLHQSPKKQAVGIYIGPESIEIVYLKSTPKGISVVKSISRDILKKYVNGNTIKEIFQKEGIDETTVATTIPEESIMLRRFTMPLIPQAERQTAIRFEAKRHIPFNIDEIVSSFHIIKEDPVKKQMDVLFVAVRKDEVSSIIALLESAGLTIERIEPISITLIKSLIATGNLDESCPPTAIIYFSTKTDAQIVITENGIPYLKREISLISKDTKTEELLLNEIRLSASYYKREFPEKNITKIIVCGLREKPAWLDYLKSELNIATEQALPLKKMTDIDLPNPQLEIPIGLASLRLEKPKIELNLLPGELIPVKYNIQKITAIAASVAICILGLIYLSQQPKVIKLKKQIKNAESKKTSSPGLELSAKSLDELNSAKTALQQKRDVLLACTKNRIDWHKKLLRLAQIMPKETWITELTVEDSADASGSRMLTLKGSTFTEDPRKEIELTNNFSKELKEDQIFIEGFKTLTLGTIKKDQIENLEIVNFDISATGDIKK